ncbi:rhodanese-like domain-containing protein [Polyangium sp. y55x31]|uniref:rhodanese-like domain-containing protein n=1 Tax=Polyangium sp. y55x31 TaxID=3042688 RepID=UPI0024821E8D|nr:rhodanese-like domain-containing protein [Polyangium sp. y55x31]MDI1478881.1 rhodanese-like domain-containing protein [Polyangium sp. y55x31]
MSSGLDRPLVLRSAALLLGSAALGLGINAARPAGVALVGFEPPTACTAAAADETPVIEMTPREASVLCGQPGTLFADTRTAERFAAGHVADAIHLPCDATASGAEVAMKELGHAQTIVVYGESTEAAYEVAETLRRRGLKMDVRVLRGGFSAWEQEGLACASGPCPGCAITHKQEPSP